MLEIKDLHVYSENKQILKGVSLKIKPGEIHAFMGPNGSGKSSLSLALMGHPRYKITSGKIKIDGKDITSATTDKRAKLGLFLAMQYPVAVPGVSVTNFLRSSLRNLKGNITPAEFVKTTKSRMADLKIDESFATRSINDGFSGGEKKKMEVLQLSILQPKYAVLDETDSGLDVDALKLVAVGIKKASGPKIGIILITHYQRILRYIKPDFVHILVDGKIVKSGDYKLAERIEEKGYANKGGR
ncbi:MAG: Fe-S cluster assembly ATPase SufC [Candidatus Woykebacteria bacterium RIFCSPLOWO2_01_FULL_41_12]|uniref:Fe-S cluster assembly ATPase SufC n=1 Tax=Candidatus Woykebacteria bacterium RIFCSPLOWO2_01_FULL_41_12 TaxID=1802604 RepID=A0A1G1WTD2_9BACT|nr:MAG: Fe-S cluster assembly ATPase SufC [Candidatus Woykebacteria bacterium RIFCSPLOWO2_01_FULL_41_12]